MNNGVNNDTFSLVAAINILYIFISVVLISVIEIDSHAYFVSLFIFTFGMLCQKSTQILSKNNRKRLQIISKICGFFEILILAVAILGLMGLVSLEVQPPLPEMADVAVETINIMTSGEVARIRLRELPGLGEIVFKRTDFFMYFGTFSVVSGVVQLFLSKPS